MRICNVTISGDGTANGTTVMAGIQGLEPSKLERVQRIFTRDGRLFITVSVNPRDWKSELDEAVIAGRDEIDLSTSGYDARDPRLAGLEMLQQEVGFGKVQS